MAYTNDTKPNQIYSNDNKPSSMSFDNDTKPLITNGDTWATILTSWEGEFRTWLQTASVSGYINDLK